MRPAPDTRPRRHRITAAAVAVGLTAVLVASLTVGGSEPRPRCPAGTPSGEAATAACDPVTVASHTASPGAPTAGRTVLPAADRPAPDPAVLASQLTPVVTSRPLGPDVAAQVTDATTGRVLWSHRSQVGQVPASTVKILTSAAALQRLGPHRRLVTRVVWSGGRIVLVGGGDPTLSAGRGPAAGPRTSLRVLADRTVVGLQASGRVRVRLAVDGSRFAGPPVNPAWEDDYVRTGVVTPVRALAVRPAGPEQTQPGEDPARRAGQVFAGLLRARGVQVDGPVTALRAARDARELARVRSAPVARLVEHTLAVSDNDAAEMLLRLVGAADGGPGTVEAGTAGVRGVLTTLRVPVRGLRLLDGSGLARGNRVSAATLAGVLAAAADPARTQLRPIVTGLPVAGLNGTLAERLRGPAAGVVRAKTGTLTGVGALAGLVVDADGALLAFAILADRVPPEATLPARRALDRFASRLASSGADAPPQPSRSVGS